MEPQPPAEAPPQRPFNWMWVLIVAVWLLLFMLVLAVGGAVVFWRQAAGARYAVSAITAEYQNINDQLTASDAKVATLSKDRSALVDQLAATNKQLANANNHASAPNAALAKLTADRNALADQLTNTNANIAKLTTERDTLAQKLATIQARQVAAVNPVPAPPPVVPNPPIIPQVKVPPAPPAPAALNNQPLAARLDAEFQAILPSDPQRAAISEAARLFENADLAAHWTDYLRALEIIREHRSKAAIPLLMRYALQQSKFNGSSPRLFSDALTILTGQEIFLGDARGPDNGQCEAAIKKFFEEWYLKNKANLTVDPARMTDDQRKAIVAALLRSAEEATGNNHSSMGVAYDANNYLRYTIKEYPKDFQGRRPRGGFFESDLCPAMTPFLLEAAGWSKNPQANPPAIPASVPIDIIPMLAYLRKDGGAPDLAKIAADPGQSNVARLTCIIALHASGEAISAEPLIAIATQEKTLEIRVYAITALQYTPSKNVAAKLVEFLGDPNEEIVAAACSALEFSPTPDATAPLKKIIDDGTLKSAILPALGALGKIKSFASADALATFLAAKIQNATTLDNYDYYALTAFCDVTGCPRKAGFLKVQDVTDALNWWNANKAKAKR